MGLLSTYHILPIHADDGPVSIHCFSMQVRGTSQVLKDRRRQDTLEQPPTSSTIIVRSGLLPSVRLVASLQQKEQRPHQSSEEEETIPRPKAAMETQHDHAQSRQERGIGIAALQAVQALVPILRVCTIIAPLGVGRLSVQTVAARSYH